MFSFFCSGSGTILEPFLAKKHNIIKMFICLISLDLIYKKRKWCVWITSNHYHLKIVSNAYVFKFIIFSRILRILHIRISRHSLDTCLSWTLSLIGWRSFFASSIRAIILTFLAVIISKTFAKLIVRVNYKLLCLGIVFLITVLAFFLCGFLGLFVLAVSTCVGMVPALKGIGRSHMMGVLILPVILYFVL